MRNVYISAKQIKAARALLDWSQDDLASAADLSIGTIRKIESGQISPRGGTMNSIVSALEAQRIEFLSSGVRLQSDDMTVLEGDDCYIQLLDDIYREIANKDAELLFIYYDHRVNSAEETQSEIRLRNSGIKWRILVEEGNSDLYFPLEEYRWFPKKFFKRNIQVVYGNKVALGANIDESRNQTTKIVIIDSPVLAQSARNLFEYIWDSCRKPPHSTAEKTYK